MQQQKMIREEQSLGDLFSELMAETSNLVRQEVALAQVELTNKAAMAGKNIGYLVVGGAIANAAMLVILGAIVLIVSSVLPLWAAALIVGIAVAIVAIVLISSAVDKLKKADLVPHETVESIKEDAKWLKEVI